MQKRIIASVIGILLLAVLVVRYDGRTEKITALQITPNSVHLLVGNSFKPVVKGLYQDDVVAPSEALEKIQLHWDFSCDQNAFTIEEDGTITALNSGVGNVWATTDDGSITARPITVFVD